MLLRRSNGTFRHIWLVSVAAMTCCPTLLSAADHFQPVSAEELAIKSEPLAPGAPAIILYRQVDRDDNGGHESGGLEQTYIGHEFNYKRIKVLTEEGRKEGNVEIRFVKGRLDVSDLRARTVRPDGSIANYDGKVFEKTIVKGRGVKYLAKTFTLPDVQVGGIIEFYWTYEFDKYYVRRSHWILSEDLFTRRAKFSLKPYSPSHPPLTVYWASQRLPAGTEQPKEGSDRIIRLDARNIPAFQKEDFMPPENELKARVDFVYMIGAPEADTDKFWRQVGKNANRYLEAVTNKGGWMQRAVAETTAASDSPETKLQKIYSRVQQIRNTSYETNKTAQEEKRENSRRDVWHAEDVWSYGYDERIDPRWLYLSEDVWKRGYGDRMDLSWLYLALVRSAGFEAYGILAADRKNFFFDPRLKDLFRLEGAIVQVKLNGKDIYCDPGSRFAPFGLLPWYETDVPGLRIDKQGASWIKTPLPASSESRIERNADVKLMDTGDLEGKLTLTYTGLEAMVRREDEREEDEAAHKKYLEERIKAYVPAATEVELTNHPDWSNPAAPLTAEFDLKVPGWASAAGRRVLVPVGLFGATEKRVFEHADRLHPIYVEFPFQTIDNINLTFPAGWQVSNLPSPLKQDGHIITYSMKADNESGKLHVTRSLDVNFVMLQTQYYPALRNFLQQVKTSDEQQVVLQQGTSAASK